MFAANECGELSLELLRYRTGGQPSRSQHLLYGFHFILIDRRLVKGYLHGSKLPILATLPLLPYVLGGTNLTVVEAEERPRDSHLLLHRRRMGNPSTWKPAFSASRKCNAQVAR